MSERAGLQRPIRVLIVDDHDVVHWGLRIMLERQTWIERSFSAHTGEEAIAQTSQHRIDLALVDLFVGAESGPDICERLHEVRPGMRLLLISGAGQISPRATAACGASGFVSKDSRGSEIIRAVAMVAVGRSVFQEETVEAPTGGVVRTRAAGARARRAGRHQPRDRRPAASVSVHGQGVRERAVPKARGAQSPRGGSARGEARPDRLSGRAAGSPQPAGCSGDGVPERAP